MIWKNRNCKLEIDEGGDGGNERIINPTESRRGVVATFVMELEKNVCLEPTSIRYGHS